jgi:hypothetical protein
MSVGRTNAGAGSVPGGVTDVVSGVALESIANGSIVQIAKDQKIKSVVGDYPATYGTSAFAALSSDGKYLAVASAAAPYLQVWRLDERGYYVAQVSIPAPPPSAGICCAWSYNNAPDACSGGEYLAVGTSTVGQRLLLYKLNRAVDTMTTIIPTSQPGTAAALSVTAVAFQAATTPDAGACLAVGMSASPWLWVYKFASGSDDPTQAAAATTTAVSAVTWCGTSVVALGLAASPYMALFDWSGSALTTCANPSTAPASSCSQISYSPTHQLLTYAMSVSPYTRTYKTSDWSLLANPDTLGSTAYAVAWRGDILWATNTLAQITAYRYNGSTLAYVGKPVLPGSQNLTYDWAGPSPHMALTPIIRSQPLRASTASR